MLAMSTYLEVHLELVLKVSVCACMCLCMRVCVCDMVRDRSKYTAREFLSNIDLLESMLMTHCLQHLILTDAFAHHAHCLHIWQSLWYCLYCYLPVSLSVGLCVYLHVCVSVCHLVS